LDSHCQHTLPALERSPQFKKNPSPHGEWTKKKKKKERKRKKKKKERKEEKILLLFGAALEELGREGKKP